MQISVSNADLSRELNLLEKIVGKKPTVPVLANVLIQAGILDNPLPGQPNGVLIMKATDFEVALVGGCVAQVDVPGAVTLPARKLMELVRAQSDTTISLFADNRGIVKFSCGGFSSRLQTLPVGDFPSLPGLDGNQTLSIPRDLLKHAVSQVRYCIADEDQRYFMKGAYMHLTSEGLLLAATDAARISLTRHVYEGEDHEPVLIPVKAIDELIALLNEQPDVPEVTFALGESHLFFDVDNRLMLSRLVSGKFPAYEKIIPTSNEHKATVQRLPLLSIIKRLVLIDNLVVLAFKNGELEMTSAQHDLGDAIERLPMQYDGPAITMKYKGEFLINFLSTADGDTITIEIKDEQTPIILRDGQFMNVVMGLR